MGLGFRVSGFRVDQLLVSFTALEVSFEFVQLLSLGAFASTSRREDVVPGTSIAHGLA